MGGEVCSAAKATLLWQADIHDPDQADDLGRRVEIAKRSGWIAGFGHRPALPPMARLAN